MTPGRRSAEVIDTLARPVHKLTAPSPRRLGGHVAVDFVNTVDPRVPDGHDYFATFAGVLAWAQSTGLIDSTEARKRSALARTDPVAAETRRDAVVRLRESLYSLLLAATRSATPNEDDLRRLNWYLPPVSLESRGNEFALEPSLGSDLDTSLGGHIALSAVQLLVSNDRRFLRLCERGSRCGWIFLDRTRNRSRRYCSSDVCGNRARSERFRHRRSRARCSNERPGVSGVEPEAPPAGLDVH